MINLDELDRRSMSTDVLSTRQVATLLGVGEATVKRWADAGEIECFRTPGGHRKFRLRDVTAIVAAVAGEQHDIGARMAACLLRAQGFEVLAPLAQTPAREMADLILRSRASLIALSSTMNADVAEQVEMAIAAARQTSGRVI